MDAVHLARWQFAITTMFHFLFVPLSIGLSLLVAIMQTMWYRTRDDSWRRMTRFWGNLFLVNFALGVVTGIVLEFQFGMNWSAYSRYVGDVFGAPLAIEGLLAFFLESTFLGLWIFGWDKLSARVHLATIWAVAIGTQISAFFILAANAWMQHPVGYRVNPATGRAEMTDFFALISNSTLLGIIAHTVLAAVLTAGMFVLGVSAYHLARGRDVATFGRSARLALIVAFLAVIGVAFVGHSQAQLVARQQPMKMAAAEALYKTERGASFSILTIGNLGGRPIFQIRMPHLLSVLATNSWNGVVEGIDDVQAAYEREHGPGSYIPPIWIVYWSFRAMAGAGFLMIVLTGVGLVLMRRGRLESSRWFLRIAPWAMGLPALANLAGWIFTEVGRQPWVVIGLLRTEQAVSPSVSAGSVATTLIGFTLVYAFLAVIGIALMARLARAGSAEHEAAPAPGIVY